MHSRDLPAGPALVDSSPADLAERLHLLEIRLAELSRAQDRRQNSLTLIVFSGDMDKLMAAFMLATGAAAMGMPVSMFFTFWGLAALKKETSFKNKNLMERLLTAMLPSGPAAVGVSKLNLCGLGKRFFTSLMRKHCVEPLSNLIHLACEMNIRMVACQTSMELMAIRKEELLAGVECGGVATCLDTAIGCGATVFI